MMTVQFDWSDPANRSYETGIDRGVLYLDSGDSVPWVGLRGVTIDDKSARSGSSPSVA